MAPVERCDLLDAQAFGGRDDGCVRSAKGKVPVLPHEFGDPQPIGGGNRLDR